MLRRMRDVKEHRNVVSCILWEIQESLVMRNAYHFIQKLMHNNSIPNHYFNIIVLHGKKIK